MSISGPATSYEPSRRLASWLLLVIIAAALALRLPALGVQSLWGDEAATWMQVNGSLWDVIERTAQDNYPPLYNLLAWLSVQAFGDAEWSLRLPAALLGIATVPLLYAVGTRFGGRAVGLLAALLLAFSGFHIWYSQEARMYTLLAFGATAHALAALRYADRPGLPAAPLLAATGCVLIYSHPYGALTLAAIAAGTGLPMLLRRRDFRRPFGLIVVEALVALAFLPWAFVLLGRAAQIDSSGFWIPDPGLGTVFGQWRRLTSGLLYLLPFAAVLLFIRGRLRPAPESDKMWMLVSWIVLPSAMGIVASLIIEPVFIARYIIGSLPPALILVALAVMAPARAPRGVAIALCFGLVAGLATWLAGSPEDRRDWRAIVTQIEAQLQPGDCVSLSRSHVFTPFKYYVPQDIGCMLIDPPTETAGTAPAGASIFVIVADPEYKTKERYVAPFAADRPLLSHLERPVLDLYVFGPRSGSGDPR